ncbi:MAG: pyridoxamine 5'-phosphate oxidase family protein [Deltaproteobacteria bacterium]
MRRSDKEISDEKIIELVLKESTVCHLAMAEDNVPYVLPMNFGYEEGIVYIHSATEGRKIDLIGRNPRVCFQAESQVAICSDEVNACAWGTRYLSVIADGLASIVEDNDEKKKALDIIMHKYSGRDGWDYKGESLAKIVIIRIKLIGVKAKRSGWQIGELGPQ